MLMFAQPTGRIVWPALWFIAGPMLALLLWTAAVELLPLPGLFWGLVATVVVVVAVGWLPFAAFRQSMRMNHTAGALVAGLCLLWVILIALALLGLAPAGDEMTPVSGVQPAIPAAPGS
jgi:apolipoprotein N-acyltransferase